MRIRVLLPFLLIGVLTVGLSIADAADPASGTISNASPRVEWTGTFASAGTTETAWQNDDTFACNPPACDTFALKVADPGTIALTLTGPPENTAGGDPGCDIRVTKPDGSYQYFGGNCGPKTVMKVLLKNAPAGNYVVDVADSHIVNSMGPETYKASASIAGAAPTPAASASPGASPSATPTATAPVTLSAKAATQSARKLAKAKKFTATLKSSGPLTAIKALLVSKKKAVGSGKLAAMNGTAKLKVSVKRKLKPGTYQLSVGGRDAQGRNVVATTKVKIKR